MPVFNAAAYLPQAIESILSQSFTNFEFIIVNDASTDSSWKIIKKYARTDNRIRCFRNKLNLGVSLTSNIAISYARGKYLARMDADDISTPDRFQKQIDFLKKNRGIIAVGSQCILIDQNDQTVGLKNFPTDPKKLYKMIFWAVPVQQSSMVINLKKLPKNFVWYDRNKTSAEDISLMFRLFSYGQLANLPDFLTYYRQLPNSLSHLNPKQTFYLTLQSRITAVKNGYTPTIFATALNLAQLAVISLLSSRSIYRLWYFIRGIRQVKTNVSLSFAKTFAQA